MSPSTSTLPCPLCGYHAPETPCPHCGGAPALRSLARPLRGPLDGVIDGLLAVPMGLWLLATTRGVKRWLVPPFLLTLTLLIVALASLFRWVDARIESVLPEDLVHWRFDWVEERAGGWAWLKASLAALVAAGDWILNAAYHLVTAPPLLWLGYFLLGSLVAWYAFSIVYEALAGPFLDEVQARLEASWFGADPRARLERPSGISETRVWRRTMQATVAASALILSAALLPGVAWWLGLCAAPLAFVAAAMLDRDYGRWLSWMARVESRAAWVSVQAAVITGVMLVCALPLYFIPFGVGYVLFACATGLATAVGMLDIPFERRGIKLRARLAFLLRNLLPFLAFGVAAGILVAIPIAGPLLMVPAASTGGLWLVCRLDKTSLRQRT